MSHLDTDNQGEGNRTAAKEYNQKSHAFVDAGKVEKSARDAADAVDSAEGEDLRKAEEMGRAHAHEEDPQVKRSR